MTMRVESEPEPVEAQCAVSGLREGSDSRARPAYTVPHGNG